ncbi:MAG: hypothetical protein ABIQ64_01560 [Candidatus Saccharimonadales bacterium]
MMKLLNPEVDTYIFGGLGSDRTCMDDVTTKLSPEVSHVRGITYSEASKKGYELWEAVDQQNVVPFSGSGPLAAKAIQELPFRPDTLTFVSPPNVITRWSAMVGFARAAKARADIKSTDEITNSTVHMISRFVAETGMHPAEYFKLIHNARRFNQLASAVALHDMGIRQVNLVVPRNDEMFSSYELPMTSDNNDTDGVRYIVVAPGHSRFSSDPLGVLHEAERAPFAMVTPDILGVAVPERLSVPPTISETAKFALRTLHHMAKSHTPHTA